MVCIFYHLSKEKKRVWVVSLAIVIRQLLLVYNMTINARSLNALIAFNFSEFIKQNVYLVILWIIIVMMILESKFPRKI